MKKTLVTFCLFASGFIAFAIEPEKDSSGNLTFTVASGAETYSGIIEGSGITVTKKGTGSLTLTGANTFSGELIVEEGILTASPTAHKGKPALVVKNGATFVSDGGGDGAQRCQMLCRHLPPKRDRHQEGRCRGCEILQACRK